MKSFWISIILLIATLIGVGANYFYINGVADELNARLDAIPAIGDPDCLDATQDLMDYWEAAIDTVNLSVGYTVVDRVSEQAVTLNACAACGDFYGFQTALALLRDAVGDMRRLERFSVGNLF